MTQYITNKEITDIMNNYRIIIRDVADGIGPPFFFWFGNKVFAAISVVWVKPSNEIFKIVNQS